MELKKIVCWWFLIDIDKEVEEIQTISDLIELYKRVGLQIPENITKEYNEDKESCLCGIRKEDLGIDPITEDMTTTIGTFTFKKLNDLEVEMEYELTEKKPKELVKINELKTENLFPKLIANTISKGKEISIDMW